MAWYNGTIPEAINESKSKRKLFVVYVKGTNDVSDKMDEAWLNEDVQSTCKNECVALKIIEDSIEYKQFSQFYPVLHIPIIFCIGGNGSVLDSFSNQMTGEELSSKLNKVVEKFKQINASAAASPTQTPASSKADDSATSEVTQSAEVGASEDLSEEEKERKAKELQEKINKIRIEKHKKAEELQRKKEMERRELGKNLQTLKEKQDEAARRKIIEERKKAKLEEKEARERVKRLLEQDRLEKKMQREAEMKEREEGKTEHEVETKTTQGSSMSNKCRLQFRLPDGTVFNSTFVPTQTLHEARAMLCTNRPALNPNSIQLVASFPRQLFVNEDYDKTLQELKLTPSAVIIVTSQRKVAKTSGDDGFFAKIISLLMLILMFPLNLLKSIFQTGSSPSSEATQQSASASGGAYASSSGQQRGGASRDVRRRGHTSRLTDIRGENDDDPTWNGNSTQQL